MLDECVLCVRVCVCVCVCVCVRVRARARTGCAYTGCVSDIIRVKSIKTYLVKQKCHMHAIWAARLPSGHATYDISHVDTIHTNVKFPFMEDQHRIHNAVDVTSQHDGVQGNH